MNLTVAITGASGAVFGREMLRALEADERVERVHFVASENSLRVMAEELGVSGRNDLLGKAAWRDAGKDRAALRCRHRRGDCQRQLSLDRNDYSALLDGHAGGDCAWTWPTR